MSETNAPEPTMEEILASIRRIISEDEAPPPAAAEPETATPPSDPPRPAQPEVASAPRHEEVLELTDRFEPEPTSPAPAPLSSASALGDLDFAPPAREPVAEAPPRAFPAPPATPTPSFANYGAPAHDEPLVSPSSADRAADHFSALSSTIAMPASGRTLEDVTRELLRPLLKEWLDQNLARIVEQRVQDEVERISRRRPT